ncbi:MAG: nitroreductase family protein [Armatimonadota bacterium]|nr:nitroreductase family protein [Armatimonadota bacterium]MCX7776692.1 nitroreductase family protein [Armatimonadota bacterium]MDW8026330.1 nitroreductase family protein [Armatimonadota bacterium]
MDAIEAMKSRRSIRSFKSDPIPREIIEDIIDCARLAPTALNYQPWEFVIVTDAQMRKRIADETDYGKFIAQAPVCVAVFCKDVKYYLEDGSAATQNILLAAHAHGLGACWVAGDKKPYANRIAELLGVPSGYKLVSLIPIGYPAEQPGRISKRKLKEVIHWEKF